MLAIDQEESFSESNFVIETAEETDSKIELIAIDVVDTLIVLSWQEALVRLETAVQNDDLILTTENIVFGIIEESDFELLLLKNQVCLVPVVSVRDFRIMENKTARFYSCSFPRLCEEVFLYWKPLGFFFCMVRAFDFLLTSRYWKFKTLK